ncbi:MAG: hypothetical protein HYW77_03060 [Parcubacteria group bacterium]|nr:hypothetical protein [Parcubacteria group bacterium]
MKSKSAFIFLIFLLVGMHFFYQTKITAGSLQTQESKELELFLRFRDEFFTTYLSSSGVEINGDSLAFLGTLNGVSIIKATVPNQNGSGEEIAFLTGPNSQWRDMGTYFDQKSGRTYLYVVTEGKFFHFPNGMQILDLSILYDKEGNFLSDERNFTTARSVFIDSDATRMYVSGVDSASSLGGMKILDLSDPERPQEIGVYGEGVSSSFARGEICFVFYKSGGFFDILNVKDPQKIEFLTRVYVPKAFLFSGWLTKDNRYFLVVDRTIGGYLLTFDLLDIYNPRLVKEFKISTVDDKAVLSKVLIRRNLAYCAWHTGGLRVINIENPLFPYEVAHFFTNSGNTSNPFGGVNDVYVEEQRGYIFISDSDYEKGGLFVLRVPE